MKLGDVVGGAYSEAAAFSDLTVTGISSDSRTVAPGNLFFACFNLCRNLFWTEILG